MEKVTHFITHRLQLKVNQAKSAVARPGQRKFLGFSFTGEREPRRRIATVSATRNCRSSNRGLHDFDGRTIILPSGEGERFATGSMRFSAGEFGQERWR
jgi:hypothetical protein